MTGNGRDRIVVLQVGGLHYGGFSAEKALLSVDEEVDRTGADEELVRGILWNDVVLVVELQVSDAQLDCAPVGLRLGIFTTAQTE